MKLKVDLSGFRELERAVAEDLTKATARGVLRRTAISGLERIEKRAKELAPVQAVDGGKLRESITTKPARRRRSRGSVRFDPATGVEMLTGPTGRQAGGNAAYQEFGTVDMPANPYMRPAADAEGEAVVDDVRQALAAQIEQAKVRMARRAARKK